MTVIFTHKLYESEDVASFFFSPADKTFTWEAGQYIRLEVLHDEEWLERWFTIASAPYEKHIRITARITGSNFKKALIEMKPGDEARVFGPDGDFTWRDDQHKKVMVAAGIGITPYRPMLAEQLHAGRPVQADILYFNRNEHFTYRQELDEWSRDNSGLRIIYIAATPLTTATLLEQAPDLIGSFVYLSGPEALIADIGVSLVNAGLPDTQLLQDWFQGYGPKLY